MSASSPGFAPAIERLLIVRLSAMGDVLHTLPAVFALRAAFPQAMLGWVIEERWQELLCTLWYPLHGRRSEQRPLVDRVHLVNTRDWRRTPLAPGTWERVAVSLSDLRGGRYQVAVDMQGAVRSALLARLSGAPTVYGFAQPREAAASMFYTRKVLARGRHVIEQNCSLAEAVMRAECAPPKVELPHDALAKQWCERELQELGQSRLVLMNPGAGWGAKRWPAERYGAVARALAAEGCRVLVNFGPGEEDLAAAVEKASDGGARGVKCSLGELIALTRRAHLFVGGDTGPLHLAAALGIPVVAIFGPTDPARNGPYGASSRTRSVVLRSAASITSHARRRDPEAGLLTIEAGTVLAAVRQLLGSAP
jgi:heptosyltransferase-1